MMLPFSPNKRIGGKYRLGKCQCNNQHQKKDVDKAKEQTEKTTTVSSWPQDINGRPPKFLQKGEYVVAKTHE